jgi:hypothetical protein
VTDLQLSDPLPEDKLAEKYGAIIDAENILGAERLRATRKLSSYFSDPLVENMIYLIVQVPPGECRPSILCTRQTSHAVINPPPVIRCPPLPAGRKGNVAVGNPLLDSRTRRWTRLSG